MNISQWHQNFKIGLDKVTSFSSPSLLPEEIDSIFNTNIEKFLAQRMYGNNPRKEGFEENQKRYDDLVTLVTNANISSFSTGLNVKPNGQTALYPSDYWHTVEEEAEISFKDCNNNIITKRVPIVPVTHDRYDKVVRDPFHQPNENKIIRLGLAGSPELITGNGITLTNYYLRYIKKPASIQYGTTYSIPTIDVQCDLPDSVHQEIIRMSIEDALGTIEASRRQQDVAQDIRTQE